jgi:hypothetical protein
MKIVVHSCPIIIRPPTPFNVKTRRREREKEKPWEMLCVGSTFQGQPEKLQAS